MSAAKQKGTAHESNIVRFLRDHGFPWADRVPMSGKHDRGDVTACPGGPVIEAKNQNRHSIAEWLDEATAEAKNAGAPFGVVWAKRRGTTDPGKHYVVLDGDSFVFLLHQAGYGEPE